MCRPFSSSSQPSGRLPDWDLDFIAKGGYVMVPPSQVSGRPYSGASIYGEHGQLDWDAAVQLLDPDRIRQAHPEPPEPEAGA